jgi:TonB family protein
MQKSLSTYIILCFCILSTNSVFAISDFTYKNHICYEKQETEKEIILINGNRSTQSELRKISPLKIKEVNFIVNSEEPSKKGRKTNSIIEVTLFNLDRPEPEIPDTLQVRVNGMKITDFENQPSPLLVFDDNIVRDQNPNNIDTRQMKWIDFHLADSVTNKYGEKAMTGLIQAQLIYPEGFVNYEVTPEFPGGESALRAFIKNNMVYPVEAIKDSLQGKVYVTFIVTKTGKIENAEIARGIHPVLDKEAIRVVSLMPDWKPGVQYYPGKIGAQKMAFSYTIPVSFKLPEVQDKP